MRRVLVPLMIALSGAFMSEPWHGRHVFGFVLLAAGMWLLLRRE